MTSEGKSQKEHTPNCAYNVPWPNTGACNCGGVLRTSEGKSARAKWSKPALNRLLDDITLDQLADRILRLLPPRIETYPTGTPSPAELAKIDLLDMLKAHADRESRLSIAAALEMTAKHQAHYIFDPLVGRVTRASCACGLEFNPFDPGCPQWEAHILSLTEADVAHVRAEHDHAVRIDELQVIRGSCPAEFRDYVERRIRMLASATEERLPESTHRTLAQKIADQDSDACQADSPEDSGGGAK